MKFALSLTALVLSATLFGAALSSSDAQNNDAKISHVSADAVLTPQQVARDLTLAKEAFSRVHPGYTRYASAEEMTLAWDSIQAQADANSGMALGDFYLAVNGALTNIRCDHTKAELPRSMRKQREGEPLYLPFRWEWIEGRALVESAAPGVSVQRGDEILTIDGRPIGEIVDAVSQYIPVDGYTEWSRRSGISQSLEFMGGGVDHFGALLWDIPAKAQLTVLSADGGERDVTMDRVSFSDWSKLGRKSEANFKDAVTYRTLADGVGYLSVDTFVNYREPVKPKTLFQPLFKQMREQGLETLILDLRRNGGGSGDAQYELLANLIDRPYKPMKEMRAKTLDLDGIRPYLWTWDSRALDPNPIGFSKNDDGTYALRRFVSSDLKTVKPAKFAFDGKLIVLTSDTNSSGSTNMSAWLKELDRAIMVGEKTGGSAEGVTAGLQFTLTLPESGVRMRLPFFFMRNNVSSFEKGMGITPNVFAPMTVNAFRENRDPALEMAQSIAQGQRNSVTVHQLRESAPP
ncbi:MAG: S41 family peptidase [Pseudomonadota bacterium]